MTSIANAGALQLIQFQSMEPSNLSAVTRTGIEAERIAYAGLEMSEHLRSSSRTMAKKRTFAEMDTQPLTGFRNVPVQMAQSPSTAKVVRRIGQAISEAEASKSRRRSLKMQRNQMEIDNKRTEKSAITARRD